MKLKEFKMSCNEILKQAFDNKIPVYGSETKDGYNRPSFFTEFLPRAWNRINRSIIEAGFTFKITYLETTHDEARCYDIVSTVMDTFGFTIRAGDRKFLVQSIDYDFIDTNNDVLQITVDFANFRVVSRKKPEQDDTIGSLEMDLVIVGPDGDEMSRQTIIKGE